MVGGIDIGFLCSIIIPPSLYVLIIYLTSPYKVLSIKTSFVFLMMGVFSMTTLFCLNVIFPHWRDFFIFNDDFNSCFWITAPKEELAKYLMFSIGIYHLLAINEGKKQHPLTYMFYFSMVGLGFALYENIGYAYEFGIEVLRSRTFSSTLLHMIVGMVFGYFIALGKIKKSKFKDRSVFGVICEKYPKLKLRIYTLIGYIFAVLIHGLWNYNLSNPGPSTITILIAFVLVGLVVVKFLVNDICEQYKKI